MSILILAAHPDDEVLGCGASIAKWSKAGIPVNIVIMAEGATSRDDKRDINKRKKDLAFLKKCAKNSAKILGAKSIDFCGFPDNRMDSLCRLDVVKKIEFFIKKFSPHTVVTHFSSDVNIDHRVIHDSVVVACRPHPFSIVKKILVFEVPSSTEWQVNPNLLNFKPNLFEEVCETIHLKIEALREYNIEMRDWPHSRSIEAVNYLAKWRGATIGSEFAEAFMILREIK